MKKESRVIIGILGVPNIDNEGYPIIAVYNDYKNVVIDKGCIPFMICPLLDIDYYHTKLSDIPSLTLEEKQMYINMVDMCDGIIIPGGYRTYEFQKYVVKYAIDKNIPVLGICAGMQLLANIDNDNYCLEQNNTDIDHQQTKKPYVHSIKINSGTLLSQLLGDGTISVNSRHRYHVTKVNNFRVAACSADGIIEAIEMPNKSFVLGVQWHPEKMYHYDQNAVVILDQFIDVSKRYNKVKIK